MRTLIEETVVIIKMVNGTITEYTISGTPKYNRLGNCFVGSTVIRVYNSKTGKYPNAYKSGRSAVIITPMVDSFFNLKGAYFA